jgi:hypothetical protein
VVADPIEIEVVAVDVAVPPGPPAPGDTIKQPNKVHHLKPLLPAPPGPPVAVAVFDRLFGNILVVAVAVASLPAAPCCPGNATPGVGFAASKPKVSTAADMSPGIKWR